jgi:hypothetical protein
MEKDCQSSWAPKPMSRKDRLTDRTIKIIEKGGFILLKGAVDSEGKSWYLNQWTNIAAGIDDARWGTRTTALEMFNLEWAFAIAPLYGCTVVSFYPKRVKK